MDDYPLLNVFLTMLYLFLWVMWFFLLFKVITDLFRDHSLNGWAKAGWLVLVILLPYLGVLIYLVVRGRSMHERDEKLAKDSEAAFRSYVRDAAASQGGSSGGSDHVNALAKLAELKDKGALNAEEYEQAKAKLLA
ncbi:MULTISPECIES: SHOCT domain-containing protein [Streptomyces]|uniref:SHOCT domain-containing protein n=1 Tax=Streptomyces TaxID=1883 RepID=UPI000CD4ED92|nr:MULTISPECIES: SHOCT domain-containing protein [Streptomyces]MCX4713035.1 SHOCT domain-containing protein [Streptomyces griseus]QXR00659.1 SHOCT domain-containing protein [Streptomyces sp. WY228]